MNVFLACFLAVIFAQLTRAVVTRTIVHWWWNRQRRAALGLARDVDVTHQLEALGAASAELHAAAIEASEPNSGDREMTALVAAAFALREAMPAEARASIRQGRKRSAA